MKNILLLDDDVHIHNAVTMLLDPATYTINICTTTKQALNTIQKHPETDLILLDIALSENDSGLNFLRAARQAKITIPIIVLTAVTDPDTIIEAFRAGATDVVRKPYLHLLKKAIQATIAKAGNIHG